jgi:hypothetical protein
MRQLIRIILFFIIAFITHNSARASHIYGLDFFYEHVTGYTYRVYLVVYGDCDAPIYGNLSKATPKIYVRNGTTTFTNFTLSLTSGRWTSHLYAPIERQHPVRRYQLCDSRRRAVCVFRNLHLQRHISKLAFLF